jgi:hypothetical protein
MIKNKVTETQHPTTRLKTSKQLLYSLKDKTPKGCKNNEIK